jgi:hypothetical protein
LGGPLGQLNDTQDHLGGRLRQAIAAAVAVARPGGVFPRGVGRTLDRPVERGGPVARGTLTEEFHLTVCAPSGLFEQEYDAMRQVLGDPRFQAELRCAVRRVVRKEPALGKIRVALTR